MKVLVIHTKYQYSGGEDTVVEEEIKLLKSKGITVELLMFNNITNSVFKLFQLFFNFRSYKKTKQKLAVYKPDVVHIHNLHFGASPSIIYAIKNSKTPIVKTLHNYRLICPSGTLFFNGKLFLNSLKQTFPWTAVRLGVYKSSKIITLWLSLLMFLHNKLGTWKNISKIIVLSEFAKGLFLQSQLELRENQIVIKSNFTYPPKLENVNTEEHFLYIGRLTEEKGIKTLLSAFSKCNYKIKIAGNGPLRQMVVDYAQKYSNIEFLSSVNKNEVYALMQNCTALIFPSTWFEGMPLTIIEAFACATIIIASKLGAMENMVIPSYNGYLFEPGNEKDLLNCLKTWVDLNVNEKKQYRLNALETYHQNYTPEKNIFQLIKIYKEAIEIKSST